MKLSKEQEEKYWEWIYNLPMPDLTFLADMFELEDIFPRVEIPKKNAIVKRKSDNA